MLIAALGRLDGMAGDLIAWHVTILLKIRLYLLLSVHMLPSLLMLKLLQYRRCSISTVTNQHSVKGPV